MGRTLGKNSNKERRTIMKSIILASILFISHVSEACQHEISVIKQGQVAECNGYLISPKMEEYFNDTYESLELNRKKLENSEAIIQALKVKTDELKTYNQISETYAAKKVEQANSETKWAYVKGGIIGLLLGGLVGFVAAK